MILFIGEILADVVMDAASGAMTAFIGGAPFNAAVSCARQGTETLFVGRVGDDPLGKFLKERAKRFPVKSIVQTDRERPTTVAFVSIDEHGERDFKFLRHDSADDAIELDARLFEENKISYVHIGSLMLSSPKGRKLALDAIAAAEKAGAYVSFDVNFRADIFRDKEEALAAYRPLVERADVVKFGEEEVEYFYGESYESAVKKMNNPLVVVTLGKEGCWVKKAGANALMVPSKPVKPVDTTGAGDAFYGAFIANLDGKKPTGVTAEDLRAIAEKANDAGCRATLHKGAIEE